MIFLQLGYYKHMINFVINFMKPILYFSRNPLCKLFDEYENHNKYAKNKISLYLNNIKKNIN